MHVIMIASQTITNGAGEQEVHPVIPFDQFQKGQRSAGPDADGNLVWTVIVED